MLSIKDFCAGDTVYVLRRTRASLAEECIEECVISSVGRKYVTLVSGKRFEDYSPECLLEAVDYGDKSLLFKSRDEAIRYINKRKLAIWLGSISIYDAGQYTYEQLCEVARILGRKE